MLLLYSGLPDALAEGNTPPAHPGRPEREEEGPQTERGSSPQDAQLASVGSEDYLPLGHREAP